MTVDRCSSLILAALGKGPLSSRELIAQKCGSHTQVRRALNKLMHECRIKTELRALDENSDYRTAVYRL